jgi:hypothetical protein
VHPGDQLRLVVGLPHLGVQAQPACRVAAERRQVIEGLGAVHLRFATAQPGQVRAVEDENLTHRSLILFTRFAGSLRIIACAA